VDVLAPILNYGILGVVVVALFTGLLWTKPSVDKLQQDKERALADKEKAEAQRDAMAAVLQDKLLPVISEFIATTRTLLPVLQQLQVLQQLLPTLQELARAGDRAPPPSKAPRKRA
jgi:1-deoxy-D-xylulose 5-phosphate reductoisomerase